MTDSGIEVLVLAHCMVVLFFGIASIINSESKYGLLTDLVLCFFWEIYLIYLIVKNVFLFWANLPDYPAKQDK